jgi:dephospho-CoA kinase
MLKVGLTGGIGCGKSAVAELFAAKGVPTIDADQVARDLVQPGMPAFEAILDAFGPGVLHDGELDRRALRERIFESKSDRLALEAILHPAVYREINDRLRAIIAPYCLLSIPLLLESGRRDFVDCVLVVDCTVPRQVERVRARDGCSVSAVHAILATQFSREQRLSVADEVIDNDGPIEDLAPQVDSLHQHFLSLAG